MCLVTGCANHSKDFSDRVKDRFTLQATSGRLLPAFWPHKKNTPVRVRSCLRRVIKGRDSVGVYVSQNHDAAFYGDLVQCGSVWVCPVCAAKISERRRVDLQELISRHRAAGGQVALITLTFRHKQGENLAVNLQSLRGAAKYFKGTRAARAVREFYGWVGSVRALEVTHGEANGWHVHFHELWFLEGIGHDLDALEEVLFQHWWAACVRSGLGEPDRLHGVTVQGGDYAAQYAGKWGLENELTKAHIKHGQGDKGLTPFDLLRLARDGNEGDRARAGELFREYAVAFHGQRQLVFSRGLKERYEVEDLSDDDILKKQDDQAFLVGSLSLWEWYRVLKADKQNARAGVLQAALSGWQAVRAYLDSLETLTCLEKHQGLKEYLERRNL